MATDVLGKMLAHNSDFSRTYQAPPSIKEIGIRMRSTRSGTILLCCSDPRLSPHQILGIDPSMYVTIVRTAGGRAFDALRSMSVIQTMGCSRSIVVMHHTDCGLQHFSDADFKRALAKQAPHAKSLIDACNFGEITTSIEDSIREDIALLKKSPLVRDDTEIYGLMYDIKTGVVTKVG